MVDAPLPFGAEVRMVTLTDFQRNAKEYLERIRRSGRPIVLTVNGKAAAVVHDAAGYQKLLDAIDRAEALEGIRRGLASMKRGEASMPTASPSGPTSSASRLVVSPKPQPRSSARSPDRGG